MSSKKRSLTNLTFIPCPYTDLKVSSFTRLQVSSSSFAARRVLPPPFIELIVVVRVASCIGFALPLDNDLELFMFIKLGELKPKP